MLNSDPTLAFDQVKVIIRLPGIGTEPLAGVAAKNAEILGAVAQLVSTCVPSVCPGARHWRSKNGAMTFGYTPYGDGSSSTIVYGWNTKSEQHFVTVQFNPSKMTPLAVTRFFYDLDGFLSWGYQTLVERASYSYLELYFDIDGVRASDYLFFDTRLRNVGDGFEAAGSLYLGRKGSPRQFIIYDKAKEMLDHAGVVLGHDRLRIEAKLKVDVPMPKLATLACPFSPLYVVEKVKLAAIKFDISVAAFRGWVFKEGMHPQDAYWRSVFKPQLLESLLTCAPDWYRPDSMRQGYPALAASQTPAALQSFADQIRNAALC